MSERFIKYIPSKEASWLRSTYPNAFLILSIIAERARRTNDNPDGLIAGDAIIGAGDIGELCGLSRKQVRFSIEKLVTLGHLKIVYNGKKIKNLENRAIKRAIKGMVVNLCGSSIWDINIESEGHQKGQHGANTGPTRGHKQERKKNDKEEIRKNDKEEEPEVTCKAPKPKRAVNLDPQKYPTDPKTAKASGNGPPPSSARRDSGMRPHPSGSSSDMRQDFRFPSFKDFDPKTYVLADGSKLSPLMANTLAKQIREGKVPDKMRIYRNFEAYENYVSAGNEIKSTHEKTLQWHLNRDQGQKNVWTEQNRMKAIRELTGDLKMVSEILQTTVKLKSSADHEPDISISLDVPPETFEVNLKNWIDNAAPHLV